MLDEQLKNYLQMETRLLTTPCIIIETEKLGPKLQNVVQKLKSLQLNKCGHEKKPLSGAECIKAIVKENHYVIATQDRDLQEWIRRQIGIALLYLHNVVPHLDEPSEASKKFINRKSKASTKVSSFEDKRLLQIKKKEGLIEEPKVIKPRKMKKLKGPNPLSCKKKKVKLPDDKLRKVQNKTIDKKKKKTKVLASS
jgi:U3 small nucleolar RNA-associated protein 23